MTLIRWEYLISTDRAEMGSLGPDGWELVSVNILEGVETFYYKRPLPSLREQITQEQRAAVLKAKGEGLA